MARRGRRVTFHGAFTSKADAQRKERKVRGFIRETRIKGKRRFMVLTAKKKNPVRVTHTRRHPGPSRPRWWPERADYPATPIRSNRRGNPAVVAVIPGRIEAIDYLRPKSASPAPDRKGVRGNLVPYRHAFRSSARMLALADGSVLIQPTKGGRRLWTPSGPKGWAR